MGWINILPGGEMAERSKAHDSKSCEVKSLRGFESHSLRKGAVGLALCNFFWRDDRVDEGARLEIVCTARYLGFESLSLRRLYKKWVVYRENIAFLSESKSLFSFPLVF